MDHRALGTAEELYHLSHDTAHGHGLLAAVALFSCKQLSVSRLQQALKKIQQSQPLLRAYIEKTGVGHHFQIDKTPRRLPLEIILRTDEQQWIAVMERQLNQPLNRENYQWRVVLLQDPSQDQHELIILTSYAIADSFSLPGFFDKVWRLYEDPALTLAELPLQPAAENYLQHLEKKAHLPPVDFLLTTIPQATRTTLGHRITKTACFSLPVNKSKKINEFCNKEGIDTEAFFSAVMLKSLAKTLDKPVSTYLHTLVNLRHLCAPEVNNSYLFSCINIMTTYHHSTPKSDLKELATDFSRQSKTKNYSIADMLPIVPDFYKSHAMVFTDSMIDCLQYLDRFALGPTVCNVGDLPFTGNYGAISWQNYYYGQSQQAASSPIMLNIASFRQHYMFNVSYPAPMFSLENGNQFIKQFLQVLNDV